MKDKEEKKFRALSDKELEAVTGGNWTQTDGGWVYTNPDGTLARGWENDIPGWEGQWFYFDENGCCKPNVTPPGWEGVGLPEASSNGGGYFQNKSSGNNLNHMLINQLETNDTSHFLFNK